jgi:hypothetical protein
VLGRLAAMAVPTAAPRSITPKKVATSWGSTGSVYGHAEDPPHGRNLSPAGLIVYVLESSRFGPRPLGGSYESTSACDEECDEA